MPTLASSRSSWPTPISRPRPATCTRTRGRNRRRWGSWRWHLPVHTRSWRGLLRRVAFSIGNAQLAPCFSGGRGRDGSDHHLTGKTREMGFWRRSPAKSRVRRSRPHAATTPRTAASRGIIPTGRRTLDTGARNAPFAAACARRHVDHGDQRPLCRSDAEGFVGFGYEVTQTDREGTDQGTGNMPAEGAVNRSAAMAAREGGSRRAS